MRSTMTIFIATVLAAMLVTSTMALPPDFFRAGRGFPIPVHKKSASGASSANLVEVICRYCGEFSPTLEMACMREASEPRKICMMSLMNELQEIAADKQWHTGNEQQ